MTNDGIISTIISCTDVLSRTGKFEASDLRDPYRIVNSASLEEMAASGAVTMGSSGGAAKTDFRAISDAEWAKLKVVGTMRIEPITFQASSNRLDDQGKDATLQKVPASHTLLPDLFGKAKDDKDVSVKGKLLLNDDEEEIIDKIDGAGVSIRYNTD